MKLGLSTAAFYGRWETEEAAQYIASLPLDCCEAFLQANSEYTPAFARVMREKLGGMPCTSVHPLGVTFENGLMSRSPRQRREAMDTFCRVLDAGAAMGAGCYVYHGRNSPQLEPLPFDLQANADVIAPLCEEAARRGMALAWENVFWCQLTTPRRVALAREAIAPVRFTLDIKQAMRAGCDPMQFIPAMGERLINVHVCDWDASGRLCLPGEGVFDFRAFFAALCQQGYCGPVILEPYLALIAGEDALLRAIAYIRSAMESLQAGHMSEIAKKDVAAIDEMRCSE